MRFCQRREKQVFLLRLNKIFEFPSCWITLKLYTKLNNSIENTAFKIDMQQEP